MKFKKNSAYLYYFAFACAISVLSLVLLIPFCNLTWGILWFYPIGIGFMFIICEIVSKWGMFYDTVLCNERGITVITRKKTYDCPWEKIKLLDQINGKSGPIGWMIVMYSQEKIRIMTSSRAFVRYVKKVAPYVKITNPWDVNYGVKL